MGELFLMNQPRRRSPLPSTLGILGSSKGNTYAVGSEGSAGPAPAVAPVNPLQVASVLNTLNSIANPEPPQRITATGDPLPSSKDARTLRPPAEPLPLSPPVSNLPGPISRWVPGMFNPPPGSASSGGASRAPSPAGGGGGGGAGGAAAASPEEGAAGDPPVFLGLTTKQLAIGGAVALGAWLFLRKKRPAGTSQGVI